MVERETGLKATVLNDSTAAAFGEWKIRYPRYSSLAMLTVVTGLGGGLFLDRRLLIGARGEAAELGQIILHPDGRNCDCGKKGCAEQYISLIVAHKEIESLLGISVSRRDLIEGYVQGKSEFVKIMRAIARELSLIMDLVFLAVDPEIAVIGGGVSEFGNGFLSEVRKELDSLSSSSLYETNNVVVTGLENNVGIIGATLYSMGIEKMRIR